MVGISQRIADYTIKVNGGCYSGLLILLTNANGMISMSQWIADYTN